MILDRIFAGLFGAGVTLRNGMYDRGQLRVNRLRGRVVSIGNISVGGAGKTPFTIMLGELLKRRGIPFDILSRGYGRKTSGAMIVDSNGSSRDFGDEPLLMVRQLGVDVVVGESRYEAGLLAERTWGPRLHLLDDGFQHRRLARQFDIVLVSDEDFRDVLLPAGRLREPLSSLARANAVVITGDKPAGPLPPNVEVWQLTRELTLTNGGRSPSIDAGAPSFPPVGKGGVVSPVAFCGIAKPKNFFAQLRALGIVPAAEVSFRDHYRYTPGDIKRLQRVAQEKHADGFITTAKDAINLENENVGREILPALCIAELKLTLANANNAVDQILGTIKLV